MFAGSKGVFFRKQTPLCLLYSTTLDLFNRVRLQRKLQLTSYTLSYIFVFVFYLFATRINDYKNKKIQK